MFPIICAARQPKDWHPLPQHVSLSRAVSAPQGHCIGARGFFLHSSPTQTKAKSNHSSSSSSKYTQTKAEGCARARWWGVGRPPVGRRPRAAGNSHAAHLIEFVALEFNPSSGWCVIRPSQVGDRHSGGARLLNHLAHSRGTVERAAAPNSPHPWLKPLPSTVAPQQPRSAIAHAQTRSLRHTHTQRAREREEGETTGASDRDNY